MADPASSIPAIMLEATPAEAGQRLDKFLAERIGTVSRSRVKVLMQGGFLLRRGQPARDPAEAVQAGTIYTLHQPTPAPASPAAEPMQLTILYEDAHLIVLDKPAGLVVHPAPGNQHGTLVNALIAHCGDSLTGIGGERRPGIVHRLDKDTSGVMVAAKSEITHARLSAAFAARDLDREYQGLCWGLPNPPAGCIEAAIGRDPRDRKRMAVVTRAGKPALTNYKTVMNFMGAAALLSLRLGTGRTHQIRVHLAHNNHPLIGDPVYLRRRPAAAAWLPEPARGAALDFPRQALHARLLGFSHPVTGAALRFEAPPPADFLTLQQVLQTTQL